MHEVVGREGGHKARWLTRQICEWLLGIVDARFLDGRVRERFRTVLERCVWLLVLGGLEVAKGGRGARWEGVGNGRYDGGVEEEPFDWGRAGIVMFRY